MKQSQTKRTNIVKTKGLRYMISRTMLVLCAAGMALTGCNSGVKPDNEQGVVDENNKTDENSEKSDLPPVAETNDNKPDNNNEPDVSQTDPKPQVDNPDITKPVNPSVNIQSSSKDPAVSWSKLEGAAKAGQSYYSEYYTKTRVISRNGYLYNYAASTQITTEYLSKEGLLSGSASGISIMLMYGSDISAKGGSGVHITGTDKEFTVFAFMKHPNENKYVFASAGGSYGTLSESAYSSLMAVYSMNHGTIRRLTPSNSEYDRILSCIKMYESKYEQYFVRSITVDDKYAFAVLSGRANAATIREYILKYENGIWEVVMDDLEAEGRLPVTVNKALPDFNMSLLPTYSIKDYTMLTDYSAVMDALTKAGFYAKDDTFYYFCGTKEFCYMITDNGKRFLCHYTNGAWECYKVLDYYDALSKLQSMSGNAPTFILLDLE